MNTPHDRTGRSWVFGNEVNTDVLAPGAYMKSPLAEMASHCLETLEPEFARKVQPGDFVVGGTNFGMGSSREQAAQVLKHLGVKAVLAQSFGGIFYRNCLNLGLLALVCPDTAEITDGDELEVDARTGTVTNQTSPQRLACEPIPEHLLEMITDGGLVPHLEKRLKGERQPT